LRQSRSASAEAHPGPEPMVSFSKLKRDHVSRLLAPLSIDNYARRQKLQSPRHAKNGFETPLLRQNSGKQDHPRFSSKIVSRHRCQEELPICFAVKTSASSGSLLSHRRSVATASAPARIRRTIPWNRIQVAFFEFDRDHMYRNEATGTPDAPPSAPAADRVPEPAN